MDGAIFNIPDGSLDESDAASMTDTPSSSITSVQFENKKIKITLNVLKRDYATTTWLKFR